MSKVRLAVIGCGKFGRRNVQRFLATGKVDLVGLCDVSEQVVNQCIETDCAEVKPRPAVFASLAEMCAKLKPEAVAIITPHTLHYDHVVTVLDAGCHVFVEKPMVTDSRHARDLVKRIKASGRILAVGYTTPSTESFRIVRDAVEKKTYGSLQLISAYLTQNWMKATAGTWRQKSELSGGGQAYDSGAHILAGICWAVRAPIKQVFAVTDNQGSPVDINSTINVRFANGALANIAIGGNCAAELTGVCNFLFDQGRIEAESSGGKWGKVFGEGGKLLQEVTSNPTGLPQANFVDAVLGLTQPAADVHDGLLHSILMDAIYESARTGMPVRPAYDA